MVKTPGIIDPNVFDKYGSTVATHRICEQRRVERNG